MSNVGPEGRSLAVITRSDLDRLAELAAADRADFFARHDGWAALYGDRHVATALCQGAALHYVDGTTGIQDFDVYSFFARHPVRDWYAKRNKAMDFGSAKFGCSPDRLKYVGRRVDLFGRSIDCHADTTPKECIQRWLKVGKSQSAKLLARKAVVLLDPAPERGTVIWPISAAEAAV